MSSLISKLFLIFVIIVSSNSLKVKINGKQKDYCFTKSIYDIEDTMKIFFLTAIFTPKPIHLLQHPKIKHMFCLAI